MKIKKEVTITLNVKELEIIVKEFVEKKGIKVEHIYFNVGSHEDPTDWKGEFPLTHTLDEVTCIGTEK
jgi:hypothetical protein